MRRGSPDARKRQVRSKFNVPVEEPGALLNTLGQDEDTDETGGHQGEDDPEGGLADMGVVNVLVDRGGLGLARFPRYVSRQQGDERRSPSAPRFGTGWREHVKTHESASGQREVTVSVVVGSAGRVDRDRASGRNGGESRGVVAEELHVCLGVSDVERSRTERRLTMIQMDEERKKRMRGWGVKCDSPGSRCMCVLCAPCHLTHHASSDSNSPAPLSSGAA